MIAAIGPRNTAYADMKLRKVPALLRIFHGTSAQAMTAHSSCPRRMLTYCGNRAVRSLAAESEFADMFTPSAASAKENAAKKRHEREDQCDIRAMGSHSRVPYRAAPAEEDAIPMKDMNVNMIGRNGT